MGTHKLFLFLLRLEWWITVLGLNVTTAGLLVMLASAFGVLDGDCFWCAWLGTTGLMSYLTRRQMRRGLSRIFWNSATSAHPNALVTGGHSIRLEKRGLPSLTEMQHYAAREMSEDDER